MNWKDKRVLITGGNGFLGSAVYDLIADSRDPLQLSTFPSGAYDLTDRRSCRSVIKAARADIVVHLAANVGGIGANAAQPGTIALDNMLMAAHVLEESRLAGVSKVILVGSVCMYPKHAPIPFREDDLFAGFPEETNAPYGEAKRMQLVLSQAYRRQYGFNSITLIPTNMYGPRDNFDLETSHVIPAIIRKCIEARDRGDSKVELWGDGRATRDFVYVDDVAKALVLAAEVYDSSDPINIGSGQERSIRDIAALIAGFVGFDGSFIWNTTKPNGQPRRCLGTTRARERLGFEATTNFSDGLRKTVDWYLSHQ